MSNTRWLAKLLRWVFTVFVGISALATLALCIVWLIGPGIPPGLNSGPHSIEIMGLPGSLLFRNATLLVTAFHGNVQLKMENADGLVEILRHYGLPVLILKAAFFVGLFELLRRLFRNVVRGESFTRQTVQLVQITGLSLIVFALVFSVAENWCFQAAYGYAAQHATIWISGTTVHLPQPGGRGIHVGSPFGSAFFFSGLLVLALSEVFRQGLALKNENDLTV